MTCSDAQLERLLDECGLAPTGLLQKGGLAPLLAVESFIEKSCQVMGASDFLCHAFDREEAVTLGSVANVPLQRGSTGYLTALQLVAALDSAASIPLYRTIELQETIWILRQNLDATAPGRKWPVQLFNIRGVFSGMKRLFGNRVQPISIALTETNWAEVPQEFAHLPAVKTENTVGLAYRKADLAMAHAPSVPQELTVAERFRPLTEAGPDELCEVIKGLLCANRTDRFRRRVADAFGMGERTYLRRLSDLGTTHAALLEQARIALAEELLADASLSIADVASEIGYAHTTDFSRFFRSKFGMAPRRYRALQSAH